MIFHPFHRAFALAAAALLLPAAAAFAATTSTQTNIYVASYGNDANDGSIATPKRHFQAAHDAVIHHGQIIVLDTAVYGTLRITKSLTVTAPAGVTALITAPGINAVAVKAGATDDVTLRGLTLVGGYQTGNSSDGGDGVFATSVGTLRVENCFIRNFYRGIEFAASATGNLIVSDTRVQKVNDGVDVSVNTSGVIVDALLSNCTVDSATSEGAFAYRDANTTNSAVRMAASHCVFAHCGYGFYTSGYGVIFAEGCTFNHNGTGVVAGGAGHAISAGNNAFISNDSDGTFSDTNGLR